MGCSCVVEFNNEQPQQQQQQQNLLSYMRKLFVLMSIFL